MKNFVEPAPLGKVRDLNQEENERLLQLPFETLTGYDVFYSVATITIAEYNARRKAFGLLPQNFKEDDIRLIPTSIYDADPFLNEKGENGALFHPVLRKCFIRFDRLAYQNPVERMRTVYELTHELAHAAMEKQGLDILFAGEQGGSLFKLNEGFADSEAQRLMNDRIMPALYTTTDLQARNSYIQRMKPSIDGFMLEAQDIILTGPGHALLSFSYLPEMSLLQLINARWPSLYNLLLRRAYRGEREEALEDLKAAFGTKVCDQILDAQGKTREIVDLLSRVDCTS